MSLCMRHTWGVLLDYLGLFHCCVPTVSSTLYNMGAKKNVNMRSNQLLAKIHKYNSLYCLQVLSKNLSDCKFKLTNWIIKMNVKCNLEYHHLLNFKLTENYCEKNII